MNDPSALVSAFISDYFRWNEAAQQRSKRAGRSDTASRQSIEVAKQEHADLLAKYCRPGFAGQSISFGIPPLHDPSHEVIVSATPRGDRCLVKTRMTSDVGGVEMMQDFEYRLSRDGSRWYLESVKCVFEGGKYESL